MSKSASQLIQSISKSEEAAQRMVDERFQRLLKEMTPLGRELRLRFPPDFSRSAIERLNPKMFLEGPRRLPLCPHFTNAPQVELVEQRMAGK